VKGGFDRLIEFRKPDDNRRNYWTGVQLRVARLHASDESCALPGYFAQIDDVSKRDVADREGLRGNVYDSCGLCSRLTLGEGQCRPRRSAEL
jgi:hypothetical protein